MGVENLKNGYRKSIIAKTGMGISMDIDIVSTRPIPTYQYLLRTRPIPAPYNTRPCFFKAVVCCLDLDNLIVALNCILFKTSMGHFVRKK